MTIQQFAQQIIDDPLYRETITARAQAGTLPPDVELFLLESADGRVPLADVRSVSPQSRTFAVVRPTVFASEVHHDR
jgi:hypothetical protein